MIYGNIAIHGPIEKAILKHTKYSKNFSSSDKVTAKIFLPLA